MDSSRISVLIPHFNNLVGLFKTLRSLKVGQRFDLVIVDDGSMPDEKPIESDIKKVFCGGHTQVHILSLHENLGVEFALNHGLQFIQSELKTEFVFRIDCGDVCVNDRIKKQISFLDDNRNICLVGSWVKYVNENGEHLFNLKLPVEHNMIKRRMLVRVSFIHSAVMFRSSALKEVGFYSDQYKAAEDYAFFYEFIKVCQTANIPEVLTQVEWSSSGISVKRRKQQLKSRLKLLLENFEPSLTSVYGFLRLIMLFVIPYTLIERIKKIVYK